MARELFLQGQQRIALRGHVAGAADEDVQGLGCAFFHAEQKGDCNG